MGITVMILLGYILTFILIIVIISLLIRLRHMERKLINFSPTEAYTIMENMHEIILESQRLADSLESAIKQKEAVLEDLSDLVDEKILKYERLTGEKYSGNIIKENINNEIKVTENIGLKQNNIVQEKVQEPKQNNIQMQPKRQQVVGNYAGKNDKKSKIIMLHNSGKSHIDIARELGISVTEVQLAVRLLPKE